MKKIHPFLRANLTTVNEKNYFIIKDENKSIENVEFIYLKEKTEQTKPINKEKFDEISMLLVDKELSLKLNFKNDPFWKLIFLKIETDLN